MTAPPPSLPFGLAPGIHAARLGDRVVVLDRVRDGYSLLVGAPAAALIQLFEQGTAAATLEDLVAAGLVARGSPRRWAAITVARRELETSPAPPERGAPLGALFACAATAAALRWRGLDAACRRLETRGGTRSDDGALAAALAAFAAARRWYPRAPRCLFDSLALLAYLRRRRLASRAVFGVRLDPFGAHCWVEAGDRVVNDRLSTIGAFTPIMAV